MGKEVINISPSTAEDWKEILNHLSTATIHQLQQATEQVLAAKPSNTVIQEAAKLWAATLVLNERLRRLELQPPFHYHSRGDE